uniref:Uncharacterized protein n=1 Tax=Strigops habroptila TaxID=2489341 RepID=A0A672U0B2_STRHB
RNSPIETPIHCSVCLEYLQDPVLLECGHNFCRGCITRWWAELLRDFPCPVCRKTCRRRALRPNRQLGNLVEAARKLRGAKRKAAEGTRCPLHGQALARFCRDDQAPVCLLCEISHRHRAHVLVPLEAAAGEYKVGGVPRAMGGSPEQWGAQRFGGFGVVWQRLGKGLSPQIPSPRLFVEGFGLQLVPIPVFSPKFPP